MAYTWNAALFAWSLGLVVQLVVSNHQDLPVEAGLCEIRCVGLDLTKLSQLESLSIEHCDQHEIEAYHALLALVTKSDNVCTMDHVMRITQFNKDHIVMAHGTSPTKNPLPGKFVRFVIGYGLRVSRNCNLELERAIRLPIKDWERLADYLKLADNKLIPIPLIKYWLPTDFAAIFLNFESNHKPKIKLLVKDSRYLIEAQKMCAEHYEPYYESIVLPLAHLSRNGLHFYDCHYGFSEKERTLLTRTVMLCESLKRFKIEETPDGGPKVSILIGGTEPELAANTAVTKVAHQDYLKSIQVEDEILPRINHFRLVDKTLVLANDEISKDSTDDKLHCFIHKFNSAARSFSPDGVDIDKFRSKLFDYTISLLDKPAAFTSERDLSELVREAIEVALHQVTDGSPDRDELEQVKIDLTASMIDLKVDKQVFKDISKMARGTKPLVRAAAIAFQTLIVSLIFVLKLKPTTQLLLN